MNWDNNIVKGVLIITLFYIVQIIGSFLYIFLLLGKGLDPDIDMLTVAGGNALMQALLTVEMLVLIYLAFRYKTQIKSSIKYLVSHKKETIIKLVGYTVALLITLNIASFIDNQLFSNYANELGENEELLQAIMSNNISISTILVITVTGPIFEEYVFRYGLMTKLLGDLNKYVAAIISTFIFAFIHIGFAQVLSNQVGYIMHLFLLYIPISLVISLVYAREDNLMLPIGVHIINNAFSILVSVCGLYLFI